MTKADVMRMLIPVKNKLMHFLARAILNSVDDSQKTQLIKSTVLKNEVIDQIEKLHEFGFTSHAPADGDTENVIFFLNGSRSVPICLKSHNRELRPKNTPEGGTILYALDKNGDVTTKISLLPDKNTITINTDDNEITIDEDGINIEDANGNTISMETGKIDINGNLEILQ